MIFRYFSPFLIIIFLPVLPGCTGKWDRHPVSWNSAQFAEIKHEWDLLWVAYKRDTNGKGFAAQKQAYGHLRASIDNLLWNRLSDRSLRHLATTAEMLPVLPKDRDPFVNDVLSFLVKALAKSGDRESLVELLSKRCPSRVGWPVNIEYALVDRGKNLQDPILVLGEAYTRCQVPETRHVLATAVRRSFADFGIRGKDESELVANAMEW